MLKPEDDPGDPAFYRVAQTGVEPARPPALWLELPYPPGVNTLYGVRAIVKRDALFEVLKRFAHGGNIADTAASIQRLAQAFPFKTREHEAYATHARLAMYENGYRADQLPCFSKPAELALHVRLFRPRRAGDIDGPLKTLLDSLQGNLFENDDQVARLEVYRHDDKQRPRVELVVTQLASEQANLFDDGATTGGVARPGVHAGNQPPDARGAVPPAVAARVVLPEPLERRLRRLARPAVISNRTDDPEVA